MPDIFPIGDRQSLTLEDCKHLITKGHVVLPGQLEKVAVRMFEQPELIAFQSAAAVAKNAACRKRQLCGLLTIWGLDHTAG